MEEKKPNMRVGLQNVITGLNDDIGTVSKAILLNNESIKQIKNQLQNTQIILAITVFYVIILKFI
jgi:hypothetical protein